MTTILYYQKKNCLLVYILVKKDIINIFNTKIRDNKIIRRLDWWTNNNKKNGN